ARYCRYDELETTPPFELRQVFQGGGPSALVECRTTNNRAIRASPIAVERVEVQSALVGRHLRPIHLHPRSGVQAPCRASRTYMAKATTTLRENTTRPRKSSWNPAVLVKPLAMQRQRRHAMLSK